MMEWVDNKIQIVPPKRPKKLTAIQQFREGDKKVSVIGSSYLWEVSKSTTTKIDKNAMKADGVLEKYSTTEESYRLLPKSIKEA